MTELAPWLTDAYQQAQVWRRQSRFHHALLVSGINGVGQSEFAQHVAQLLLCEHSDKAPCGICHSCQVAKADTHPDWLVLDGREGGIRVDAVRQVVAKVANKPQLGFSKVVVIHEAHEMNVNAANAILKALEEPPSSTYFILTTHTSRALIPTILSRCQRVMLPAPDPALVVGWVNERVQTDVSDLLWFSKTPYQLLRLVDSKQHELLQALPDHLMQWLDGGMRTDELAAKVPKDGVALWLDGLLALLSAAIHYSATGQKDTHIESVLNALLSRYDVYRLMNFSSSLTGLKRQLDITHLNPTIQLVGELNSW